VAVRIKAAASLRLDGIRRKTRGHWDAEQVDLYITDLFAAFDKIEVHGIASRPIPAEFAINGFFFRHEHHFVYWRRRRLRDAPTRANAPDGSVSGQPARVIFARVDRMV
jgi:toxin ParE1/3/4